MKILLSGGTICYPGHSLNGQPANITIHQGKVESLNYAGDTSGYQVFDCSGCLVSPGWLDVGVQSGDPGFEHREDTASLVAAAARGGYTRVAIWPTTNPALDSKASVHYVQSRNAHSPVMILPIGAVSEGTNGKSITEMLDMYHAGAVAFGDGSKGLQHAGLMLLALQYVKAFGGLVVNQPMNAQLSFDGHLHEGLQSTLLGMRGIPALAEEMMVMRDLKLLEYTQSKLHIANVSSAQSVAQIRTAKAQGLAVTASVAIMNLLFDDEALQHFESFYKVLPPLRLASDRQALWEGLLDGTLDFISSNHCPWDEEHKKLEFPYASFGASTIETTYAALRTLGREWLANTPQVDEKIVSWFGVRPAEVLGVGGIQLEIGEKANLTIIDPQASWEYTADNALSKSLNSVFLNTPLQGKIRGTFHGNAHVWMP